MGSGAELPDLYRQARELGARILELLHAEVTDGALDEIDGLIARRGELLARTADLAAPGDAPGEALALARELADQQRALETELGRAMKATQAALQGRQATRENLAGVNRILNPSGRSRMINQRR